MLAPDEISRLAVKLQTTQLNIRREFIQHQFLRFFYQQPDSEAVLFKGGTALRIIYGSPRFSEDLDFSSRVLPKKLESLIIGALDQLSRENLSTEIIQSKTTSGGYLSSLKVANLPLILEVSLRSGKSPANPLTIVSDFTAPYLIFGLNQPDLVSEKIQALISRGKPRDYYDLYFLLRANLLNKAHNHHLSAILKSIKQTKINFSQELKVFLPKSHWPIVSDFKQNLIQELNRHI